MSFTRCEWAIIGFRAVDLARMAVQTGLVAESTVVTSSTSLIFWTEKKRDEGFIDGSGGMKRSRSDDSQTDVANVEITADAEKREPDTSDLEPNRPVGCDGETYSNRIHWCLVVSPAGNRCSKPHEKSWLKTLFLT